MPAIPDGSRRGHLPQLNVMVDILAISLKAVSSVAIGSIQRAAGHANAMVGVKDVIIPFEKLSPEALQGLIEEFVTRPGTDSGYTRNSLSENVDMVKRQLRLGEALIVFDCCSQTANIVSKIDVNRATGEKGKRG